MKPERQIRATIVDVAREAGLSIGTVSNYLNGQTVRRSNRYKIETAIAALSFSRNQIAVSMKTTKSRLVGMLVPSLSEFHGAIVEKISAELQDQKRALLTYCHNKDPAVMAYALNFFQEQRVCAIIVAGHSGLEGRLLDFSKYGIPIIGLTNDSPDVPMYRVLTDSTDAARKAVGYLSGLGHREISVITGDLNEATARERFGGYRQGMEEWGLPLDDRLVIPGHYQSSRAYTALKRSFSTGRKPSAILSCSGSMTFGALRFFRDAGMQVPGDISLISFDDSSAFQLRDAPITVLAQPTEDLARTVGSVVSRCADSEDQIHPSIEVKSYEFVKRESCLASRRSSKT
ncbi:LacI family DNA-binding transcriptional regulator [Agrobacterium cavarae]|uniref:LacI family DNA-binding transcriptional regulator n=1 Tax=Agrobacterium cavarae TaxID=2528239 RepID=UPI002897E757|nr:LacI family DNA-binding transcriptional regulator [Agrobacterium cavarae]